VGIEFTRPWAWLLLPLGIAAVLWIDHKLAAGRAGRKRAIARVARLLLICLLVGALSGTAVLLPGSQAATWVLADLSASAAGQRQAMAYALSEGLSAADATLSTGLIAFGRSAMVGAPLLNGRNSLPLDAAPDASGTDIARALSLALALLPDDAAGRVALLSDGLDNAQGVEAALSALKARGIAVDVLPFASATQQDAQVTAVTPPAQVYQGERFDVAVRVDSLYETRGTLVLSVGGEPVATREVTLRKGENHFIFEDTAESSGVITYGVQLTAQGDANSRNDRLGAYMDVRGVPQVLVVGDGEELAGALRAAGMGVSQLLPGQLPLSAQDLRAYHAVALVNVNEDDLAPEAVAALDDYVRMLGHGLLTFGGDDSYALGGWRGSALEEMLPVTMDAENRLDMPTLALVLVIDKSGSMTNGRYGITQLDMAKEAAARSTEVLTGQDFVGVIAFDDTAKWVVPMQQVSDLADIQSLIGTIRPGGGTMFYSALTQAWGALSVQRTQLKHIIFLTDGESGDSNFEEVIDRMVRDDITLTTVAVGSGANQRLLSELAEQGKGRFYTTSQFDDIPKIFTKETFLATQAYAQNRTFYPVVRADGALTDYAAFPALHGYLVTTARPLATVALSTDKDEPLLAWWQYGAGRVASWTSDIGGAWTGDLLRWEEAAAFLGGMVSHVLPTETGEGELTLARDGDTVRMRYTMADASSDLTTEAMVFAPDGTQQTVSLAATAPGVYEGELVAAQQGAYAVRVEQHDGDTLLRTLESGLAVGYSTEYDVRAGDGDALLRRLAAETGGRVIDDPSALFAEQGAPVRARRDLTAALLVVALVLFVLDAAQRRLAWEGWLPQKEKAEQVEKVKPEKAAKPIRAKTKKEAEKPEPPAATETAEKLLAARRKKLM
jgi:uncharacterized membrane protein